MNKLSIFFFLLLAGCQSPTFIKVDFKYSNLAHMKPSDATVELDIDPELLVHSLSDSFRAQNNQIIEREKVDYVYGKTKYSDQCWAAQNEIFKAEFKAYEQNNFKNYENINRSAVFSTHGVSESCTIMEKTNATGSNSWLLKVEIPQGNYDTTISVPNIKSFLFFSNNTTSYGSTVSRKEQVVSKSFSSVLYIWASNNGPNSKSKVYLFARPISEQIESCVGCSIGHNWWKQSNGFAEFKLVKHYKYLLEDLARSDELLIQLNKKN